MATWQPSVGAGLIMGIDTGLWTLMTKNGDGPQKVEDLAEPLGIDPALLRKQFVFSLPPSSTRS